MGGMIKAKNWKGNDLKGVWLFTLKIDGVRVLVEDGVATSRNGKKLYNIPEELSDGDYECFLGNFKETIIALKTIKGTLIPLEYFYSIDPVVPDLSLFYSLNPTSDRIEDKLMEIVGRGHEGLVLRQKDVWLKVKKQITHDVKVVGYQPGKGRHEGRMGALITNKGKVGTGFTDAERIEYTEAYILGKTIEVEGMELTAEGKIRHPRFKRLRLDK